MNLFASIITQPERIRGETYSITSDVWSLGLTLLELAMNRFPLVNINEDGSATPLQPFELLQTVVTFEMPSMNQEEGVVWTKSLQHFIKTWFVPLLSLFSYTLFIPVARPCPLTDFLSCTVSTRTLIRDLALRRSSNSTPGSPSPGHGTPT